MIAMGRFALLVVLGLAAATNAAVISCGPVPGLTTSDEMAVTVNGEGVWVQGNRVKSLMAKLWRFLD
jgi:hypothetical protein